MPEKLRQAPFGVPPKDGDMCTDLTIEAVYAGCTVSGDPGRLLPMSISPRTVFDMYQETIARGILAYALDDADKYRLVARSLRERAIAPEMAFQRKEVIGLAARFEVLAIEADYIQEHLVDMLFAPRAVRSSLRNLPL